MTIETKYNIHDIVWMMYGNKPTTVKISRIETKVEPSGLNHETIITTLKYGVLGHSQVYFESAFFETKEELIASL